MYIRGEVVPGVGEVGDSGNDGGAVSVCEPGPEIPDESTEADLYCQIHFN